MESFIRDFEKATGIQRTSFNVDSLWKEKAPAQALESLDDFLDTVRK
jgi:hypothetical protein